MRPEPNLLITDIADYEDLLRALTFPGNDYHRLGDVVDRARELGITDAEDEADFSAVLRTRQALVSAQFPMPTPEEVQAAGERLRVLKERVRSRANQVNPPRLRLVAPE